MSVQDRLNWIAAGSPFRLMRPAADLRDVLRGHGYTVYDIGNKAHLEHEPPEDHTPYSETGWPGKAKYGVGYAVDIMPKAGLPSLQQLGARILADRNAGAPGIRWLKYMNWEPERDNGGACWHESWQPNYDRRSSSDRGHIHLSGLTGFEDSTIGAGYDPVARIRGEDDLTAQFEADVRKALLTPRPWAGGLTGAGMMETMAWAFMYGRNGVEKTWLYQTLQAIAERSGIDADELAAISEAARQGAASVVVDMDEAELARQVLAALPPDLARQIVAEFGAELVDHDQAAPAG